MDVSKASHMDPTCMLKAAEQVDLTVNLFKDGVNGSYRTLPLNVRSFVRNFTSVAESNHSNKQSTLPLNVRPSI